MTEPDMVRRTGLIIREHQKRTVANFCELQNLWTGPQDSPYMPVLQGWSIDDYLHCMDAYYGAGINLARYPLVGVGSICRRQGTKTIKDVVNAILRLDPDMPLHTFGAKSKGLRLYGHRIASADSLAWSFQARRTRPCRDTATRPAPTACPTPSGGAASCCPHCRRAFSHRNSEKRNEWQAKAIPPRAWPRNWPHRLQMYSGGNSAQSIAFTFAIAYYRIRQKPLIKKGMK